MQHWLIQHWIEIAGTLFGLLYIVLEIKQSTSLWLVGIITSTMYVIVFFQSKFYADMMLNVYYVVISCYGWYVWKTSKQQTSKNDGSIKRLSLPLGIKLSVISFLLFISFAYYLIKYTDSTVAIGDALTAALSIVATWMLTKRILEQWLVWIVVNVISVVLYWNKELYPTTLLFFVYLSLAVVGYIEWKKQYIKQNQST